MSDWRVYEIEDVIWDVFGTCDDHIVPRPKADADNEAKSQYDSNKKARLDLQSSADEVADKAGTGECNMYKDNEEFVFNSSFEDYQCNGGHFSHEISSSDPNIGFIKDENVKMKNSDILDYEWSIFDDFEDVDHMFRHDYPTFGQGSDGLANELSWFSSSSYTMDDSKDTLKSRLQSSCSELNVLKAYSNHHESNTTNWTEKVATNCFDYDCIGQWLDADAQNNLENDYRIDGSNLSSTINSTSPNHMDTYHVSNVVNSERDVAMRCRSEGIKVDQKSGYISGSYNGSSQSACYSNKLDNPLENPTTETYTVGMVGDSNHFLRTHSSNNISLCSPASNLEVMHNESSQILLQLKPDNHPIEIEHLNPNKFFDQTLIKSVMLAQNIADNGEKLSPTSMKHKLHQRDVQQNAISIQPIVNSAEWRSSEKVSSKPKATRNELKSGCHTGGGNELGIGDATLAFSTLETMNSSVQGSSCTTSSGSIMSGSSSLQKLQEVMRQLDIKTKLCLRDGLYRLARNAENRHNSDIIRYGCKEEMLTSNIMLASDPIRYPRLLYEETGTNPIDRSIAHLLFYTASGHSVGPAEDAMSVES